MNYKILILLIVTSFLSGCLTSQTSKEVAVKKISSIDNNRSSLLSKEEVDGEFDYLKIELEKECKIYSYDEKIKKSDNYYLKIVDGQEYFEPYSFKLTKIGKNRVGCLKKVLSNSRWLIVQVVGQSNESTSNTQNRYLANKRAISVAEQLYKNSPIGEIFAKGCSATLVDDVDRGVLILLYNSKSYIKDPCLN